MTLQMRKGTYGYQAESTIFEDVSLTIEKGEIFCLLGHNGAGKSTLLHCLAAMEPLRSGEILLENKNIWTWPRKALAKHIAYVPQNHVPTFPFPVIDIVLMGRNPHKDYLATPSTEDRQLAEQILDMLMIGHLKDRPYTEISGGERQLALIGAALAQESDIIILDEPTAHLDFGNQYRLLQLLQKLSLTGKGIVMCTHFPDHALAVADKVAVLHEKHILAYGTPEAVLRRETIQRTYQIDSFIGTIRHHQGETEVCIPIEDLLNK